MRETTEQRNNGAQNNNTIRIPIIIDDYYSSNGMTVGIYSDRIDEFNCFDDCSCFGTLLRK